MGQFVSGIQSRDEQPLLVLASKVLESPLTPLFFLSVGTKHRNVSASLVLGQNGQLIYSPQLLATRIPSSI